MSSTRRETPSFSWLTAEGRAHLWNIVQAQIPQWADGPRPQQLEAWSHTLNGKSLLLIASTGFGKTSVFYVPIIVMQYLLKDPIPGIPTPPKKPVALIVSPLIELGTNQAKEIEELGLRAVSVNDETLRAALKEGRNLYHEIAACHWSIVFLSAERLISKAFDAVVRNEKFRENIVLLGIDEAHILVPWGVEFRLAYRQVPLLRDRLPDHVPLVVVTATLAPGPEKSLCSALKLRNHETIRLSSERTNIRTVILELGHSLAGLTFPAIDWVFKTPGMKAVVYCRTIELVYRVTKYGWSFFSDNEQGRLHVRMWSALTSSQHNLDTLELLKDEESIRVIVATISFGMGMNVKNIKYSINLGIPDSCDALFQQNGRAGRDLTSDAIGITYIEPSVYTVLKETIEEEAEVEEDENEPQTTVTTMIDKLLGSVPKSSKSKGARKKKKSQKSKKTAAITGNTRWVRGDKSLDLDLARMLLSSVRKDCLNVQQNRIYQNPGKEVDVSCQDSSRRLRCSSCELFTPPQASVMDSSHPPPPLIHPSKPPTPPLTVAHREHARGQLLAFGRQRWTSKHTARHRYIPHVMYWTTTLLDSILDQFTSIHTLEDCRKIVAGWEHESDIDEIFALIKSLNARYLRRLSRTKVIRAQKAAATRAKTLAAKLSKATTTDKENTPISNISCASQDQPQPLGPPTTHGIAPMAGPSTFINTPAYRYETYNTYMSAHYTNSGPPNFPYAHLTHSIPPASFYAPIQHARYALHSQTPTQHTPSS